MAFATCMNSKGHRSSHEVQSLTESSFGLKKPPKVQEKEAVVSFLQKFIFSSLSICSISHLRLRRVRIFELFCPKEIKVSCIIDTYKL